jgi:hypothetical protein
MEVAAVGGDAELDEASSSLSFRCHEVKPCSWSERKYDTESDLEKDTAPQTTNFTRSLLT